MLKTGCKTVYQTHMLWQRLMAAAQHSTGGAAGRAAWNTMRTKRLDDDACPHGKTAKEGLRAVGSARARR